MYHEVMQLVSIVPSRRRRKRVDTGQEQVLFGGNMILHRSSSQTWAVKLVKKLKFMGNVESDSAIMYISDPLWVLRTGEAENGGHPLQICRQMVE